MCPLSYSQRLGPITNEQFQAALTRFNLGTFIQAEPIPFGLWGQNVFVTSTTGAYVLRGQPHMSWQFPAEHYYARLLHEHIQVPVPWPYLLDERTDIFGWSYVLMPRMQGLQLANPQEKAMLSEEDKIGIAHALGENLAHMHDLTWPYAGRYDEASKTIQPLELKHELTWPFPPQSDTQVAKLQPRTITYSERVTTWIRHHLMKVRTYNDRTTAVDVAWAEGVLTKAQDALNNEAQPCFIMEDYKEGNLVVTQEKGIWRMSGVFDLMEGHFGDGEADLSRQTASYLDENLQLAREFVQSYLAKKPPRPGFAERFPIYMLQDRLIIWEFLQRTDEGLWGKGMTLRRWAEKYASFKVI